MVDESVLKTIEDEMIVNEKCIENNRR